MTERENGTTENGSGRLPSETEAAGVDAFPLDDALIALLAEQAAAFAHQRQGALTLFVRQHKLQGNWQVAPNGRELVRSG
jgi:hypothetical protein